MATGVGLRISRLRALIDHPRTGGAERAAAQRMLDRILRKAGLETRGGGAGDRTYGSRHDRAGRHADTESIAELIRDDIAFARAFTTPVLPAELTVLSPIRDAPAQLTYTVDSPCDGRIVITVENVPRDWGWSPGTDTSPALRALADELAEIMNGYNHTGTDIDQRFFGSVRVGDQTLIW